ncbi:MAG: hypothetical protein AMXMBFR46_01220 [Acidimicrobiia bacterium]
MIAWVATVVLVCGAAVSERSITAVAWVASSRGRDATAAGDARRYWQAHPRIRSKRFRAQPTIANLKSEFRVVEPVLAKYEAVFERAVELSSGVRINFFTSKLDRDPEPLRMDDRALDVLMSKLIAATDDIADNPAAAQTARIRRLARRGRVELVWNVIAISDERQCLVSNPLSADVAPLVSSADSGESCVAGLNFTGTPEKYVAVSNQVVVLLDTGRWGAQFANELPEYYENQDLRAPQRLGPDQWMALTIVHEAGHALLGLTGLSGTLTEDEEHELFVEPLESELYDYFCGLPKRSFKYLSPLHVDTRDTSHPG